jgi:hypothetical protein
MLKEILEKESINYFDENFKKSLSEIIENLKLNPKNVGIVEFEKNGKQIIGLVDKKENSIVGFVYEDGKLQTTPVISMSIIPLTKIL